MSQFLERENGLRTRESVHIPPARPRWEGSERADRRGILAKRIAPILGCYVAWGRNGLPFQIGFGVWATSLFHLFPGDFSVRWSEVGG